MKSPDFYEGVRALILEKDNQPAWSPPRVEGVIPSKIGDYFRPDETFEVFARRITENE